MLWHDETVKKDICALYDRRTSFLGDDDIYITLSNVGTGRDVCPAPDPVNIVPCPGPACGQ